MMTTKMMQLKNFQMLQRYFPNLTHASTHMDHVPTQSYGFIKGMGLIYIPIVLIIFVLFRIMEVMKTGLLHHNLSCGC